VSGFFAMRQRILSLRRHLFILGLLIVFPLLVVGFVISVLYVLGEQKNLRDEAISTVHDAATTIDHEVRRLLLALEIISRPVDLTSGNFERVYQQAKQLSDTIPGSVVSLRRVNGEGVFNTLFPLGTPLDKGKNDALLLAEAKAVNNAAFAISDVFVGLQSGKTYVAIVQPVMSDGKVAYLLDLRIPTELIATIMSSQLRHPEWLIGVTGKDDRMIARNWESERYVGQKASDGFIQNTQGDGGVFENSTLDGVHVFNAYTRSKLTGWRIGTGIPIHIFRAPLYYSALALAGILAVGLLCSVGLSYAYARVMLRPAAELRKLADARPMEARRPTEHTGIREFDTVLGMLAKSFYDLEDRERHQQTLVQELNHRAKNTLTAIQAIALQTHRQSKSWEEFRNRFEYRLMAMARSFDLLIKSDWRNGDLREVITDCSKPFCDPERIRLTGPPVVLPPKTIVGMGMIVHELATNATKYGAFSNPSGWVEVNWEIQKTGTTETFHFQWKEHEGPAVTETAQKGFGSALIASTIETELHGKAETKIEPDGLYFCASFPVHDL
jgi:two-component sensor histidine kinase